MKNNVISEYAEALFLLSKDENKVDGYFEDMTLVKRAFDENPDYVAILSSPALTKEEKNDLIDKAFSPFVCENVASFIKLFCERGRIDDFSLCYEYYEKLYNNSKRLIVAEVTTAVAMTEAEKKKLKSALTKRYGVNVELNCLVDKSILGGMIIKTEDSVTDGSLKTKIREIKDVIRS